MARGIRRASPGALPVLSMSKKQKPSRRSYNQKAVAEERRARISELHRQGKKQYEIAKEVGCDVNTVVDDIKVLRAEWAKARLGNMDEVIGEQLAKLDLIEQEAWVAYFRSCEDARIERVTDGEHGCTMIEVRGQTGDPRHHDTILKIIKQRREMLGTDAPTKSEEKQTVEYKPLPLRDELAALLRSKIQSVPKSQ